MVITSIVLAECSTTENISDTITDPGDQQQYKTVELNNKIRLAENMRYEPKKGDYWIYFDIPFYTPENLFNSEFDTEAVWDSIEETQGREEWFRAQEEKTLDNYGYLYSIEAALEVCPKGWHIPSESEFETLYSHYESAKEAYDSLIVGGESGFSASFGGERTGKGDFYGIREYGLWWTSSTEKMEEGGFLPIFKILSRHPTGIRGDTVCVGPSHIKGGYLIRCVKD